MRLSESISSCGMLSENGGQASGLVIGVALILLAGIGTAVCVQVHHARVGAARYLRVVIPMRIGTTYDLVEAQMRTSGASFNPLTDCSHACTIESRFVNTWQYKLHLGSATGLVGRLDFEEGKLVYKATTLGRDFCCAAHVAESASTISKTSVDLDSTGQYGKIIIDLSATDFTQYRAKAYSFNLKCIGSMRGCGTAELLPTLKTLEYGNPERGSVR